MTYTLRSEFCIMPSTTSGPYVVPARGFRYAIRRQDGSLVFRTETRHLAHEIMDRLNGGERS